MAAWNVFDSDAFSLQSLTAAINHLPFTPSLIASLGVFEEEGLTTTTALVEEHKGTLGLVPVAPRSGPGLVVTDDKRKVIPFAIPHMPQRATINADEVQNVREFGSETAFRTITAARDKRLMKMRGQIDYTIESHRLAAIKGNFVDVNGNEVSLATTFGVSAANPINFALGTTATEVQAKCLDVINAVEAGLGGDPYTSIEVLCGSAFWASLITHGSVKAAYANWTAAVQLSGDPRTPLNFGGLRFYRYRGTSAVKIADDDAQAFARGVDGLFLTRFAPANYIETANTTGLPYYAKAELLPLGKGIAIEAQGNALNICTRPASLVRLGRVSV
jgi:hypothetical protein